MPPASPDRGLAGKLRHERVAVPRFTGTPVVLLQLVGQLPADDRELVLQIRESGWDIGARLRSGQGEPALQYTRYAVLNVDQRHEV